MLKSSYELLGINSKDIIEDTATYSGPFRGVKSLVFPNLKRVLSVKSIKTTNQYFWVDCGSRNMFKINDNTISVNLVNNWANNTTADIIVTAVGIKK